MNGYQRPVAVRVIPYGGGPRRRVQPDDRDRRYRTSRWTRTAKAAKARDGYRCWVQGCLRPGTQADHIIPVYEGMPDSLFYSMDNIRAACRVHNVARGVLTRTGAEAEAGRVFKQGVDTRTGRSRISLSQKKPTDYSRKPTTDGDSS